MNKNIEINNHNQNDQLLKIDVTVENLAMIYQIDAAFLNQLQTNKHLCQPLKNIKQMSQEFQKNAKNNISDIYIQVEVGSKIFKSDNEDAQLILEEFKENQEIAEEDKQEYIKDLLQTVEKHKNKFSQISKTFNLQIIKDIFEKLRDSQESINTFNLNIEQRLKTLGTNVKEITDKKIQKTNSSRDQINQLKNEKDKYTRAIDQLKYNKQNINQNDVNFKQTIRKNEQEISRISDLQDLYKNDNSLLQNLQYQEQRLMEIENEIARLSNNQTNYERNKERLEEKKSDSLLDSKKIDYKSKQLPQFTEYQHQIKKLQDFIQDSKEEMDQSYRKIQDIEDQIKSEMRLSQDIDRKIEFE